MVNQNNEEEVAAEEAPTPTRSRKKKSKYTHVQEAANLRVFDLRVKEADDSGDRKWNEYKIAATSEKEALRLINHDGYAPYTSVESDDYEG